MICLTASAWARLPKPPEPEPRDEGVAGEYIGRTQPGTFPTLAHRSTLSFVYRDGKVTGLESSFAMYCGTKELAEGPQLLDYAFGARAPAVGAPKGIFLATENGSISAAEIPAGEVSAAELPSGRAKVKVRVRGVLDGEEAWGTFKVLATDGTPCFGGGNWRATRMSR